MTGVILVVDDVPANIKLLEAKLTNEYYDVVTARDGYEALDQVKKHKPDLVLLDVMMPGLDGFETCRRMKEDPDVSHIPVVMVTALSETSDRVQGLEAGADDFITKPINDTALFARVKSLIRIKVLIDELRLRDQSGAQLGVINDLVSSGIDVLGSKVMVVDDDAVQSRRIKDVLSQQFSVSQFTSHLQALDAAKQEPVDLIVISSLLTDIDGLRLATQFKAIDAMRHVPVIMLVDENDQHLMLKALDLGVNDYLLVPLEPNELSARVKTQLRRKKYQDALKNNYKESVSMAITDSLTGLYNRHYLDTHLKNLTQSALTNRRNMSLVIMDMDHFKQVNDTYGHDVGDEMLRHLGKIIVESTRSADLAARFGGEEFVILMPETDFQNAYDVAERMRRKVENTAFQVSHEVGTIHKTISIGVSTLMADGDTPEGLLKRADQALYAAKHGGRNRVLPTPQDMAVTAPRSAAMAPSLSALDRAPPAPPSAPPSYNPNLSSTTPQSSQPLGNYPMKKMVDLEAGVIATPTNPNDAPKPAHTQVYDLSVKRHSVPLPLNSAPKSASAGGGSKLDDEPPGTF